MRTIFPDVPARFNPFGLFGVEDWAHALCTLTTQGMLCLLQAMVGVAGTRCQQHGNGQGLEQLAADFTSPGAGGVSQRLPRGIGQAHLVPHPGQHTQPSQEPCLMAVVASMSTALHATGRS